VSVQRLRDIPGVVGWGGTIADRHVRFVFSTEPVSRLATLGARVSRALASAGAGA
jgi:hypothetical protein